MAKEKGKSQLGTPRSSYFIQDTRTGETVMGEDISDADVDELMGAPSQEYIDKINDPEPKCAVCGETPEQVKGQFMMLGERNHEFVLPLCHDCGAALASGMVVNLPPEKSRAVISALMSNGRQRATDEEALSDVSGAIASMIALTSPDTFNIETKRGDA